MKEILIYLSVAFSGLFILGYSVHMLIGGFFSRETEVTIIAVTCVIGAGVIAYMAWDVVKHRSGR